MKKFGAWLAIAAVPYFMDVENFFIILTMMAITRIGLDCTQIQRFGKIEY
jgi:hypothetical protein